MQIWALYRLFLHFLLALFLCSEVVYAVECGDIDEEQTDDNKGIEDGIATYEIKENVIGGAITTHKEHIVVVDKDVYNI